MQKSLVRDTTLDTGAGRVALEGDVRRCHCKSSEELRAECPRKGAGTCWVCPATRAGEEERRGGGRLQATAGQELPVCSWEAKAGQWQRLNQKNPVPVPSPPVQGFLLHFAPRLT